jgi:putative glutathione S-transferase
MPIPDHLNGKKRLNEIYLLADPRYTGTRLGAGAVGQGEAHDRHQRVAGNHPHAQLGVRLRSPMRAPTITRPSCAARSTRSTPRCSATSTTASYRCGFASTQEAYEEAFLDVFGTLDSSRSGCHASAISRAPITEADWRLFTTLVRFDAVYYSHFKCNLRRIATIRTCRTICAISTRCRASPRR